MTSRPYRHHPGSTLIELMIFLAIMSVVASFTLPMLFSASESRLLQQTVSVVEQNGAQVIQNIGLTIRNAETILYPPPGQTASFLAIQTGSGSTNPTIIGAQSGAIVIIEHAIVETISTEQVGVEQFRVRNTSNSEASQSVAISFVVTRTLRLQQPHSYTQHFDVTFGLLPDDDRNGACSCPIPACVAGTAIEWYVCDTGTCLYAFTPLACAP